MNSRGRRTQERAARRRMVNIRLAVAEKIRRDKRHQEKAENGGG
jgi:hypothetical protein